tara:strand:- start:8017 stop:8298 length:282 start_codon:yes stop_codon:yes gene_type:complete
MVNRLYHPSNIVGSTIVNAVTGKPYSKCYVGSNEERNFFRVIDSSGLCNIEGLNTNGNRIPNKLFYDSKEQYIEHRLKSNKKTLVYKEINTIN